MNLISHFVLIREFLPGMLRKRKGHIVTIASMASFVAAPGLLDYCCSKVGALYVSEGTSLRWSHVHENIADETQVFDTSVFRATLAVKAFVPRLSILPGMPQRFSRARRKRSTNTASFPILQAMSAIWSSSRYSKAAVEGFVFRNPKAPGRGSVTDRAGFKTSSSGY